MIQSCTRYEIVQHLYDRGYGEVLHITNAPEGCRAFVIHHYCYSPFGGQLHAFSEWKTLSYAKVAYSSLTSTEESCKTQKGFIRFVDCAELAPYDFMPSGIK